MDSCGPFPGKEQAVSYRASEAYRAPKAAQAYQRAGVASRRASPFETDESIGSIGRASHAANVNRG
jgi:hypothetical protein